MSTPYHYKELSEEQAIRVLVLHASSDIETPILCDLEEASLHKAANYAAISYSWGMDDGDVSLCRNIIISGRTLSITQNLYDGLRRIRLPNKACRLWIDAISIDQQNIAERSSQVTRMGDIYSCADSLIIWLGEGQSQRENAAVFALLSYEHNANQDSPVPPMLGEDGHIVDIEAAIAWADCPEALRHKLPYSQVTLVQDILAISHAVHYLFNKRYWGRRWIVQELFHPELDKMELLFGPYRYPKYYTIFRNKGIGTLHTCYDSIRWDAEGKFGMSHDQTLILGNAVKVVHRANNLLRPRRQDDDDEGYRPLTQALYLASDQDCVDDRDRLYAFLSMEPRYGIKANYNLTTAQVYTLFAKRIVEIGLFDLLLWNLRFIDTPAFATSDTNLSSVMRLRDLPSWAPDLRKRFEDAHAEYDAVQGTVDDKDVLSCELLYYGVIEEVCDDRSFTISTDGFPSPQNYRREFDGPMQMRPGDVAARTYPGTGHTLILRSADGQPETDATYKLVQVLPPQHDLEISGERTVRIS